MKLIVLVTLVAMACVASARNLKHKPMSRELIEYVNAVSRSWRAGESKFDSWKLADVKQLMGVMPDHERVHQKLPLVHHQLKDIPATFDARTQWPKCQTIGHIRDQGSCGSCWAFGAVEAMSDRVCIGSNSVKTNVQISSQDLLTCCDSCGFGCNGGYPEMAWEYFVSDGLVTGGDYNSGVGCEPYTIASCDHHVNGTKQPCGPIQPTPECTGQCISGYNVPYTQDKVFFSKAYAVSSDVKQIQMEILTNGPVEVSYNVYADFVSYKSGVYYHVTGDYLGGHAVKMLGWGTEDNIDYWLIANSWNEDWGDKGYFKIRRGTNECGIEAGVVAGLSN